MGSAYSADPLQERFDAKIARLAATQHGAFSREQAMRLGGTKSSIHRRVACGRWERIAPRVYRIAGTGASWRQSLLAACLAWGAGVAVSHRGAAPVWNVAGFEPGIVELTVPRSRHRAAPGIVHRLWLPPVDVSVAGAIPVTTPARTLIDLASVAPLEAVEEALDDALRRGMVSIARLRWRVDELACRGRPGIGPMKRLLDARDPAEAVPDSVFERRLLRTLRESDLPPPVLQHEIRDRVRTLAIVDFAYPDAKVAIEADGYRWHSGRARWELDLARRNRLTLLGWRIIHVTWNDLIPRAASIVEAVRNALAQ